MEFHGIIRLAESRGFRQGRILMNPTPATPANRDLLWLIFGALMLIAGLQLIPIRGELRECLGRGALIVAGVVFAARVVAFLLKQAEEMPAPLTERADKDPFSAERK